MNPAVTCPVKTILRLLALCVATAPAIASAHLYVVASPTHEQTFAYGSEQHQAWVVRGPDRHLAVVTEFTNDPYVDRIEPRQYDDFTFDFPNVRLGADGRTFYYHTPGGKAVAVAERYNGFLGLDEVRLLDNAVLIIKRPHGYLTLTLLVNDRPSASTASL
jgi:hypothetical protein